MPAALLYVCTTCRAGQDPAEGVPLPGAMLHARLAALLMLAEDPPVRLTEAKCLANCERGCAAAITMPGKWSYLLGGLDPACSEDLLDYAATYHASGTGVVMPSRRPRSLTAMVCGRIPPGRPDVA